MAEFRRDRRFQEVVTWIEEQVRTGTLQPGDRLPPERSLVEQFGISRTVVREALQSLAARGLIESHVGRGTFVRLPDTMHLTQKLGLLMGGDLSVAQEALTLLVEALTHLAVKRSSAEEQHSLLMLAPLASEAASDAEAFMVTLGRASQNPLLATIGQALAGLVCQHSETPLPVDFETVAARVASVSGGASV